MFPPSGARLQASHQLKPNSLRFVLGKPFLEEGKGMDDRSPEVRFALDSPLEEAVSSELVSEARFPASREFTENFIDWGLSRGVNASKNGR